MRHRLALAVVGLWVTAALTASEGKKSLLAPPEGVDSAARGQVEIEHDKLEVKLQGLAASSDYSVWLDDAAGALAEVGSVTTNEEGKAKIEFKASGGEGDGHEAHEVKAPLPFDAATPDQLAGRAVEVRDADGAVALAGVTPDLVFTSEEREGEFLLQRPDPAVDEDATGQIQLKQDDGRVVIKLEVESLDPVTVYEVSLMNPDTGDTEAIGTVTTGENGKAKLKLDTHKGDPLPFGVGSVAELEGLRVRVSDPDGNVVLMALIGAVPVPPAKPEEQKQKGKSCLVAADPASGARGELEVEVKGDGREKLEVEVKGLAAHTVYSSTISAADGSASEPLGDITTNGEGEGEAKVTGDALPLGAASVADLAGATVSVADSDGAEVLSGVVPALDEHAACGDEDGDGEEDTHDPELKVESRLGGTGGKLEVKVEHVAADTAFDLVIVDPDSGDSEVIASVTTSGEGKAEVELKTSDGDVLPLGAASVSDLVGKTVNLVDEAGEVVLSATVPSPAMHTGADPGAGGGAALTPDSFAIVGEFDTLFLRGDSNADSAVDISDPVFTLNYLFSAGSRPLCLDAADANDDGAVDISDPISSLLYLFGGAVEHPSPGSYIGGFDPSADLLHCVESGV